MSANINDNFLHVPADWTGAVGSGGVSDGTVTTIPLVSSTNLPTDTAIEITIDRVDSGGTPTPSKKEVIKGIVSSTNLISCVRGIEGTAQAHSAGAIIEVMLTAAQFNAQTDAILVGHNQDGTHILDTDVTLTANSDTKIASQKAVKTYADAGLALKASLSDVRNDSQIMEYGMARQAIMNGNFDIWQRGTSLAITVDGNNFLADRWIDGYSKDGGTYPTLTRSRQLLTSGDIPNATYFTRLTTNGAGASLGANSYHYYSERIENGVSKLCGLNKKVTKSFYARSSIANKRITPTLTQSYGTGGSPSTAEFILGTPITLTSTWTKYTVTFTTNTLVGKTFGTNNDDYLGLDIWHMWGATFGNTRVQAGVTAETYVGAGNIDIAQVQLCAGDVALPFQPKSQEEEQKACDRYYQRYAHGANIWVGYMSTGGGAYTPFSNRVKMRATPTVNIVTNPSYTNASGFNVESLNVDSHAMKISCTSTGQFIVNSPVYDLSAEL